MEITITLADKRVIKANSDYMTVKARKAIKKSMMKEPTILTDDKEVLADLEKKWKDAPPTQMNIYEGFLLLIKPTEVDNDDETLSEELVRACCRWVKDGVETEVTKEEFLDLPFAVAVELEKIYDKEEQSFFVSTPKSISASPQK